MSDETPVTDSNSILNTVKRACGLGSDYTPFDLEIIIYINGVFMTLTQLGVGPDNFSITDENDTWASFSGDIQTIQGIKAYVSMKTKLQFDPPPTSFAIESMQKLISEYEFRLNISADSTTLGN